MAKGYKAKYYLMITTNQDLHFAHHQDLLNVFF